MVNLSQLINTSAVNVKEFIRSTYAVFDVRSQSGVPYTGNLTINCPSIILEDGVHIILDPGNTTTHKAIEFNTFIKNAASRYSKYFFNVSFCIPLSLHIVSYENSLPVL